MPDMTVPVCVRVLLDLFAAQGEVAYPVGGCVRDMLMGILPHDWDVAVTTVPERTTEMCEAAGYRVIPTGMAHGTVTVLIPTEDGKYEPVECTTCRTESGYSDGRHPDTVSFTGHISDDLSRRDFTVNAMALAPSSGDSDYEIIDPFGGRGDLDAKLIRCVGDPDIRLAEDALRVMRAVRFAVKLGFDVHSETRDALVRQGMGLARISRERIRVEFEKTLCSPEPERGMALLDTWGLMPYVLPRGISPYGIGDLSLLPNNFTVRMTALLWGLPAEARSENLDGLRLSNEVRGQIDCMLAYVDTLKAAPLVPTGFCARALRSALGSLAVPFLMAYCTQAIAAPDIAQELITMTKHSEDVHECVRISDLAIGGKELIALGIKPGRAMGMTLNALLNTVMQHPEKNTREALIKEVLAGKY